MRNLGCVIFVAFLLFSCSPVLNTIYGVNKNRVFESKEDIVEYYHGKQGLDKERLYFFTTEKERNDFMVNELAKLDNAIFYGLHVNDSTKVDDSVAGDKSCIGVVDNFILNHDKGRVVHSNLAKYKVFDVTGKKLSLNESQPTVVFVVDSNFGRFAKTQTNYIVKHIKEQDKPINYIYISTDIYPQMSDIAQK